MTKTQKRLKESFLGKVCVYSIKEGKFEFVKTNFFEHLYYIFPMQY